MFNQFRKQRAEQEQKLTEKYNIAQKQWDAESDAGHVSLPTDQKKMQTYSQKYHFTNISKIQWCRECWRFYRQIFSDNLKALRDANRHFNKAEDAMYGFFSDIVFVLPEKCSKCSTINIDGKTILCPCCPKYSDCELYKETKLRLEELEKNYQVAKNNRKVAFNNLRSFKNR